MRNRPTARHILIAALFLSILTPMTGAHADGALDNTFGDHYPKNGILTLAGSVNDNSIFNDLAAQGNKTIVVGSKASDLIVARIDSSGVLDSTFGSAGVFYMTLLQIQHIAPRAWR